MFRVVVDGATAFTRMDQLPPIKDIAGIEVSSGPATMPLQYKAADGTCGLVMIWTKDGK